MRLEDLYRVNERIQHVLGQLAQSLLHEANLDHLGEGVGHVAVERRKARHAHEILMSVSDVKESVISTMLHLRVVQLEALLNLICCVKWHVHES